MTGKSIKDYLLLSWLIPIGSSVVGSCLLALGLSYLDYSNYRRSEYSSLRQVAPIVARRAAAELLLRENGRIEPVLTQLKAEFRLQQIVVTSSGARVPRTSFSTISLETKIPGLEATHSVVLEKSHEPFQSFIHLRHFILALIPIGVMAALGLLIQRNFLRRHFIDPIENLAETSTGSKPTDVNWPLEIQSISQRLVDAFSSREQAVFGQVARGIIHDVRTHLNSMQTAVQLVESAPLLSDQRAQRLEKLYSACSRNIPKIRDIVDISLDTSREISLHPIPKDVSETIRQAITNLDEVTKARGVRVLNELHKPLALIHDPIQLERVFTNLIKNAAEAADESKKTKAIRISASCDPNFIHLDIEDSGPGLTDPALVFRPLKSTKTHGIGLGLFVSRKIIEAHQGQLIAGKSEILGGAKFTVKLPLQEARI